jgi:transcriptional regulator with XRE-family HTH domain
MTTQQASADVPLDTWSIRLVIARTQRGFSQDEAADRCGVKRASWANWERGVVPRGQVDVTRKIAEGLGYDLQWLMWGGPLRNVNDDDGGERARQDSNLRPVDYRPASLLGRVSYLRDRRSTRRDRSTVTEVAA